MEKKKVDCTGVKLFSLISLIVLLIAYALMPVKRASYLLPVYPFITIFLAQYAIHITEYRTWCTRLFAAFFATSVLAGLLLMCFPQSWNPAPVIEINLRSGALIGLTCIMLGTVYYQLFKKINIKILYASIALTFAVNMLVNATGLFGA